MLKSLLSRADLPKLEAVQFLFLFIERDKRRVTSLTDEVTGLGPLPDNVKVTIRHGSFETVFGSLLAELTAKGKRLIPTFAFIDPFGYADGSAEIAGRLLDFPQCEVLYFLPLSFVLRFVGRAGQEDALTALFGSREWEGAVELSGPKRSAFLLDLFERQLARAANVKHVRSFRLETEDGNDYRLVFGLGHDKGLEIAKDAMWQVDPVAGTSFRATTDTGQEVLFTPETLLDTAPLLAELRARFGTDWFTTSDAERCTLINTPFRKGHLIKRTLQPAEKAGALLVERVPGSTGFQGARMRFLA